MGPRQHVCVRVSVRGQIGVQERYNTITNSAYKWRKTKSFQRKSGLSIKIPPLLSHVTYLQTDTREAYKRVDDSRRADELRRR